MTLPFTPSDLEAHIPRLRRYARALTGNRDAADDLTQDTLERAWEKRALWRAGAGDPKGSLRAWLFAVMHNVFVNTVRRMKVTESLDAGDGSALDLPAAGASAETDAAVREIGRALMQLADEQRAVILLVGLEQLSYAEAAFALDVPIGTVMSRLSRGRERLRQLLDEDPERATRTATPSTLRRVK
ncbi:MAG: RNA polymerase sigma factor [Gemmatimonadota bacterium]